MRNARWLLLAALVASLASCAHDANDVDAFRTPAGHVEFGDKGTLTVRIAQTDQQREQGLMGVRSLPADEGMAFLFPGRTTATFWMKDTPLPLSIAFVASRRVVAIDEMRPCAAEPCPTYGPARPYTYAIEANAGWFRDHGIEAGDEVTSFDGPFSQ